MHNERSSSVYHFLDSALEYRPCSCLISHTLCDIYAVEVYATVAISPCTVMYMRLEIFDCLRTGYLLTIRLLPDEVAVHAAPEQTGFC